MGTLTLYRLGEPEPKISNAQFEARWSGDSSLNYTLFNLQVGLNAPPSVIEAHIFADHFPWSALSVCDIARFDIELLYAIGGSLSGVVAEAQRLFQSCFTAPQDSVFLEKKFAPGITFDSPRADPATYRLKLQNIAMFCRLLGAEVDVSAINLTEAGANRWAFPPEPDSFFRGIEEHVRGDYAELGPVRVPILSRRTVEFSGEPALYSHQ